jgi:hypothetical protein
VFAAADRDGPSDARAFHEEGRRRNLGVSFDGLCTVGSATYAAVSYPIDSRDAELQLYPSDGGLKMSVASGRAEGQLRWPSC